MRNFIWRDPDWKAKMLMDKADRLEASITEILFSRDITSGKSTLINTLIGKKIPLLPLSVGNKETGIFFAGNCDMVEICYHNGTRLHLGLDEYSNFVTEPEQKILHTEFDLLWDIDIISEMDAAFDGILSLLFHRVIVSFIVPKPVKSKQYMKVNILFQFLNFLGADEQEGIDYVYACNDYAYETNKKIENILTEKIEYEAAKWVRKYCSRKYAYLALDRRLGKRT